MSEKRSNVAYLYNAEQGAGSVTEALEANGKPFRAVVEIRGQVQAPGEYPYRKNTSPLEYLREAGGPTNQAASANLVIIREENQRKRSLMFDLTHAPKLPEVMSGDILVFHNVIANQVPASPERSGNASIEQQELLAQVLRPAFKRVLSQIVSAQTQNNLKSLALLSAFPNEGKSLLCAALALGYAELLNARVLVLDASKNSLSEGMNRAAHFVASVPKGPGVKSPGYVDYLKLDAVGNGKFETTDFQVGRYLESMKQRYDLLLLDISAVDEQIAYGMDPLVITAQTDAALMVLSPRSLKKEVAVSLKRRLEACQVRLLGCVYNDCATEVRA